LAAMRYSKGNRCRILHPKSGGMAKNHRPTIPIMRGNAAASNQPFCLGRIVAAFRVGLAQS
jgi:hypothetical protein